MNYASFYGGRKGASFVIVKNYPDILTMTSDFSQGGTFTEVNFDEYVIINTANKNHPDNGKIFRRGYDYNSDRKIDGYIFNENTNVYEYVKEINAAGAIYIGTIVGPAGRSPHLVMTTYADAQNKQAQQNFNQQKSSGEYNALNSLVPGKYQEEGIGTKFNDKIEWYCTSIRDNTNEDGIAYIGFKIPYLVIDYTTESVEPYNDDGNYTDTSKASREDDRSHPFYEQWKLSIPKGIKGDSLQNFKVITPSEITEENKILDFETGQPYTNYDEDIPIPADFNPETYDSDDQTYEGYKPEDHPGRRLNGRQILVYDYYNYDEKSNPKKNTYYIGDYNEITDFSIDNYGTVTVAFTHNDTITYHQLMKHVTNITLDSETGHFIARYNTRKMIQNSETGQLEYERNIDPETNQPIIIEGITDSEGYIFDTDEFDLNWVKNITFNQEDGSVTIHYTQDEDHTINNLIKWITDINIATQQSSEETQQPTDVEGTFKIEYNYGQDLVAYLKWVNGLTLSDTGQLTLHYSGNGTDQIISYRESDDNNRNGNFIKWIKNINLTGDGTLSIIYNTGVETELDGFVNDTTTFTNIIKWITNVNFKNDGSIEISYNTGEKQNFNKITKWIKDISLDTNTGKFRIDYQNNEFLEKTLKWPNKLEINTNTPAGSDQDVGQGYGTQKVKVYYSTQQSEQIGEALNYIMQTYITGDKHLLVLYSDPAKRQQLITTQKAYRFGIGVDPYEYKGYSGWFDLGSIHTESGVLVGLNIDPTTIDDEILPDDPTQEQVIAYLNNQYATGFKDDENIDLKDKIVTVGIPGGEKNFYAFDYSYDTNNQYKGWYYLGAFTNVSAALSPIDIPPVGLQEDALWFMIQENYFVSYAFTNVVAYPNLNTTIPTQKTVFDKSENCQMYLRGTNINASIMMNGVDVTSQYYNSSSGKISIPAESVTGDIVITAVGQ